MKIDLKKYFEERDQAKRLLAVPGPVITFSREYGCEANRIAGLLVNRINEMWMRGLKKHPWRMISKEIIDESAHALGLKPDVVDRRVQFHSDIVTEIFSSFTYHYNVSDRTILNKIKEIIMTYATRGNVIIIGRGGAILTRQIPNALHVKLMAPLKWRARIVAERRSLSEKDALDLVQQVDRNRIQWQEHVADAEYSNALFDLIFNVRTVTDKEIVDMIIDLMQHRRLISGEKKVVEGSYAIH